jgi:hypothetical protein
MESNMRLSKLNSLVWKIPLTVLLLGTLAAVAARGLVPEMPLASALLYALLGTGALFVILVLWSVIAATLMQFILKHGGTDPDWFWFNGEPPGLQQLREGARSASQGLPTNKGGP